jgi:tetratricopeptide (TPR) repeat protein
VRALRLVVALLLGAVAAAPAQLAVSQPTTKLLVLPFQAAGPDSGTSILVADAVRDRLGQLAKYKMVVITKKQLCDVLAQSGFSCDGMLDEQQAQQLARHLQVHAYTVGTLEHHSSALSAHVRVLDIGSSGMAANFVANSGTPGTPQALAESVSQRINAVIKASEHTRDCIQARMHSQFARALAAAQKALATDPNSTGAHLCVASVYETQRMPVDSIITASKRALAGDSLNATAWENIARVYQQKGDTLKAIDAFIHQLRGEPRNIQKRLGIAQLLRQLKQYQQAVDLLDEGLKVVPGDQQMVELKGRICIEGELWTCTLATMIQKAAADSTALDDSILVKTAIAAAEHVPDSTAMQAQVRFSRVGTRKFPQSVYFWKKLGAAYDRAGKPDSAVIAYRAALAHDSTDISLALVVAKAIAEGAPWDTAAANRLKGDTAALGRLRSALADRVDSALVYVNRARASSDSTIRLNAYVIELTAVSKLGQAGASDRLRPWVEQLAADVAPRSPADTVGPRMAIRVQAAVYYVGPALQRLVADYRAMAPTKSCGRWRDVNDELTRLKGAMGLARRVSAGYVAQLQTPVTQIEQAMSQVKKQFKCA